MTDKRVSVDKISIQLGRDYTLYQDMGAEKTIPQMSGTTSEKKGVF